jgi:hypothetical protein
LTNVIIATIPLKIISETLIIESILLSAIADFKGIKRPTRAIKVTNTAMCAIVLLLFFNPLLHIIKITPNTTGIRAVKDNDSLSGVDSKEKYAHKGIIIRKRELIKLA